MTKSKDNYLNLVLPVVIFSTLLFISVDYCYFWDNIQQTSKEAHFFLLTNFQVFPTNNLNSEFSFTGYHPPLMGILTAISWKTVGYNLWVSHVFIFVWALILIYNLNKLLAHFFSVKHVGWMMLILLLEPSVLSQFVIASPDFILLTAFVVSLRAVFDKKYALLTFGLFFLFAINMRGVFAGFVFIIAHFVFLYYSSGKKISLRDFTKNAVPYMPVFVFLGAYYLIYFSQNGWFFTNSAYSEHYKAPSDFNRTITHFAEFALRLLENGRILIVGIATFSLFYLIKKYKLTNLKLNFLFILFIGLFSIYFLFIFITQMPFSPRYYMPFFLLLSILALKGIVESLKNRQILYFFIVIIAVEITGNLWVYPDKIAKSWDTTLAHTSYYSLRNECFRYIDENKMDYNQISAGFCLYGNRKIVELTNIETKISGDPDRKYFIYSNISNVEDSLAAEFNDKSKWIEIKRFEKGFVFISILKRV